MSFTKTTQRAPIRRSTVYKTVTTAGRTTTFTKTKHQLIQRLDTLAPANGSRASASITRATCSRRLPSRRLHCCRRRESPKARFQRRPLNVRAHRTLDPQLDPLGHRSAVPATAIAKQLIIGGSTSVLPLAQKLATAYHKAFPKIPTPKVGGGQSDIGISGAASGRFDIGTSSRNPIPGVDPKGLVFTKIAQDGICIITSPQNAAGQPLPADRRQASSPARSATGARCRARKSRVRSTCSTATAPPVHRTPSSTSSSAKR